MMKSLLAAFRFLTIVPLGKSALKNEEVAGAAAWFPLVGYALGLIYLGTAKLLGGRTSSEIIAFLILALMVVISGGLHLDGLSDWADSFGGRDREARLRIMKDSRAGSFGIVAIAMALIGKMVALSALVAAKNLWPLLLAPALARLSLSLIIAFTPYARSEGGTGQIFGAHKKWWHAAAALVIALAPIFLMRAPVLWLAALAALLVTALFRLMGMRLLGGFTGDLLGACAEVSEMAVLLLCAGLPAI